MAHGEWPVPEEKRLTWFQWEVQDPKKPKMEMYPAIEAHHSPATISGEASPAKDVELAVPAGDTCTSKSLTVQVEAVAPGTGLDQSPSINEFLTWICVKLG